MDLKRFTCTTRVFDPGCSATSAEHVLSVDSPAEHAAASTLANAASITPKTSGGTTVKPVAFACVRIEPRT